MKSASSTPHGLECDIEKTQTIAQLLKIPIVQRDDSWYHTFYMNIPDASFACSNPQVLIGPDGFPYFILMIPEPNQPFESFCIRNMTDDFLLQRGWGVAINPAEKSADWVFSYGDIMNLNMNNEFFTEANRVVMKKEEIIKIDENILCAQPSDSYLPAQTRSVLRSFLIKSGLINPQIMMVSRSINGEVTQELVFNVFPEDFPSEERFNFRLQQISWFLPRYYMVLSISKNSELISNMTDL